MASVTGGHEFERWTGDLEPRVLATDLLKREGCPLEPATPRTRRAIGGMAVGAVLTFGAVVGTLIPHSGAPAGNGANLADQQVSYPGETSQQAPADAAPVVVTPAAEINNNDATTVAAAQSAATQQAAPDRQSSAHRGGSAGGARSNTAASGNTSNAPASNGTGSTTAGSTTASSAPSTYSSSPAPSTSSPAPSTASAPSSSSASTSSASNNSGGLVGSVLDGLLHPVTGLLGGL